MELIPPGLMHIEDLLQREIIELAGERYKRKGLPFGVHQRSADFYYLFEGDKI